MSRPPSSRLASASIEGTLLVWSINSSNSGQARRRDERTSMPLVIAVDLGGTKIRVGTVETDSGLVRVHDEIPTPSHAHLIVSSVVRAVRELMERDSGAIAVGIASAGVIDTDTGTVVSAGPTIPGWAGTLLGARVSNATGLRTLVMNDVHATALGELAYGALVGLEAGLVVSVGTGVGSAATLGRRVACGQHGLAGPRIEPCLRLPRGHPPGGTRRRLGARCDLGGGEGLGMLARPSDRPDRPGAGPPGGRRDSRRTRLARRGGGSGTIQRRPSVVGCRALAHATWRSRPSIGRRSAIG
jgi:hypothetical protein